MVNFIKAPHNHWRLEKIEQLREMIDASFHTKYRSQREAGQTKQGGMVVVLIRSQLLAHRELHCKGSLGKSGAQRGGA
jgi:hypothetical protein